MAELEWADPPPLHSQRGEHWDGVIRELRKNPGKWAIIHKEWKSSSAPPSLRKAGIETTARANKDGKTYTVYGRAPVVGPFLAPAPGGLVLAPGRAGMAPPAPPGPVKRGKPSPALDPAVVEHQGGYLAQRRARGIPPTGK